MERGEVETSLTSWNTIKASRPQWIAEKKINILVQYSRQRLAELPDVPAFTELGKTAEDKQLLAFYVSAEEIGRSFLAPPGMPADRVATLRAAFDAFTKDAEVLAEVAKINAEFNPMSGVELQKLVAEVANTPTAIVDRMQALLR